MSTGANIRRLREQRGLTQEQLGKMVDVSRSTITQWERGWTTPRMGNVQLLAGALGVSTADIIAD